MKKIVMFGLMIGCYVGLLFSFMFSVETSSGASMNKDGKDVNCVGIMYRTQSIYGDGREVTCFRVNWMNYSVCHRCYNLELENSNIDYYCKGDNPNSTNDFIQKSDIMGVIIYEVCI